MSQEWVAGGWVFHPPHLGDGTDDVIMYMGPPNHGVVYSLYHTICWPVPV
jgi:hypothetical protein